ncbi:MAG: hypothetical protein M1834_005585 [Cirrosporium novae-zelandiae]|nr:MAG: hypothetical protein M1834_005585 [Cirrosporium novae-zelandiae]
MGFIDTVKAQLSPSPVQLDGLEETTVISDPSPNEVSQEKTDIKTNIQATERECQTLEAGGVANVEAVQAVWGKRGKYVLVAGLGMMMFIFELDNSTVYNYQNYATSSFNQLALLSTLSTATTIIQAVIKPTIAKVSDVIGRAETYMFAVSCYVLSYILCASSKTINCYAAGVVFYAVGQSSLNLLHDVIIGDVSSMRWRALAIGIAYTPYLLTPWIAAFIVDSVVNGIGWRWGIGMFAIIMPFGASFIVGTLLHFQHRAKKLGLTVKKKMTIYDFCSRIDLGGIILLTGGFGMLFLPMTLAATSTNRWRTPWIIALLILGALFLIALVVYEKYIAKNPVVPTRYFRNLTIVLCCSIGAFDTVGFSDTHTYLYAWSVVAHDFSARNATFLAYTNGVTQCLSGIIGGAIVLKTRRPKWVLVAGVIIRFIGYGVMIRLRGQDNSTAELFVVQLIQGIGSGFIETLIVTSAQVVVPHAELAQVTSLVLLCTFLGSAVGTSIAGAIYTNTFREALRKHMAPGTSEATINSLFQSITGILPAWGSSQRIAANAAYSDVMRYISISALALSVPMLPLVWFLPNLRLRDDHNFGLEMHSQDSMDLSKSPSTSEK